MNIKYKYLNKRFTNKHGCSGFVLKYVNTDEVYFKFDATGWVGCFQMDNIKKGKFKDKMSPSVYGTGVVGDGEHKPYENGRLTRVYVTWSNIIARCYDENRQERQPAYKGCSVATEWLNYQNFANWYLENYPTDGKDYQLDKDYLVKGNKVYGPDTCCFLTPQQNIETSHAKHYRFISPSGEAIDVFNLSKFCRENNLHNGNMTEVALGKKNQYKGWTKA
jgi:hypothetical protein